MKLALFDFDGTITTHDSFREFILFIFGKKALLLGALKLSPWLLGYIARLIPNHAAKRKVVDHFFKGMSKDDFEKFAKEFVRNRLNKMIRPDAMKKILWHLQNGDRIIVVSASFQDYLKHWCDQHKIEIIGTKLEWKDGVLTGNFDTNCWGQEKVRRIKEHLNIEDYDEIFAYGDSRGDKEMLEMADHKGFRIFTG
ncbi:MAG: HAD-IB family hydrolase [Candidatus Rifleibacteriota bacterium]